MTNLEYITAQLDKYPKLSHASNILTKNATPNISKSQKEGLEKIIDKYAGYLENMLGITGFDEADIRKKVELLNDYYQFFQDNGYDNLFTSQSKLRSTILEEFLFLLFKDYVADIKQKYDTENVLDSGSAKAYSNLYFKAKNFEDFIKKPEVGINQKDQDYAIFRTFDVNINNGGNMKIRIPAVAMEAKTYIDKTMLDSIIATAEKLKSGNPHTRFVAVTERYDVDLNVDPAYSRIDQIYVLRGSMKKGGWKTIDEKTVIRLFNETKDHLDRPWSDIGKRIDEEGVVI